MKESKCGQFLKPCLVFRFLHTCFHWVVIGFVERLRRVGRWLQDPQLAYPTQQLKRLIQAHTFLLSPFSMHSSAPVPCFNVTAEYYPCADITGCGGGVGDPDALSWDYQSCTQIVSNVDTNNVTDMFPPAPYNFDAVVAYCAKRWGTKPE